jgi:hypothetical protein
MTTAHSPLPTQMKETVKIFKKKTLIAQHISYLTLTTHHKLLVVYLFQEKVHNVCSYELFTHIMTICILLVPAKPIIFKSGLTNGLQ